MISRDFFFELFSGKVEELSVKNRLTTEECQRITKTFKAALENRFMDEHAIYGSLVKKEPGDED